jgi:hypothetical protein
LAKRLPAGQDDRHSSNDWQINHFRSVLKPRYLEKLLKKWSGR